MCFGTPRRDHVSTYLLLNDIHFRDVYNLIRLSSCLLAHSSSENTAHCEGALPVDSRAEFFIMRSDRVEPYDLWIKKKNSILQTCGQTLSWFYLSAYARRCWAKVRGINALINLLEEVKEFTPIQRVFTFVASMYECAVQVWHGWWYTELRSIKSWRPRSRSRVKSVSLPR